ncbi:carbohydrate ABC transporter permease [Sulfitobacter mediterraneus]|jgi:multiple sugar transport system permease protein|uniref:carbohydrate ABC transporter permease n=1 Tax=Sulfitobacter TaxID=60136 RepID=UPI001932C535|nr:MULTISPECIES: carbohydrate ABC transporter permease [Sulfitobacter]MBM1634374.1 carbohydrate ABC transporter permease [Sulfitobacter mediterraneus]MBM1642191.1 carbohydrate ABC transporter permease [Sulfitobacter mediterraneus]MBM1646240.1 carbohydrate ABC transporter permease [Sulfitobacter mediterraneus]MBM1650286.1 carbohydrate ABC transporter permease [Sulfitobacter mediterraneus]MBM1654308.1 carbohydrate ABC transporter permease [Sulfitobacter mediterraneus]
MMVGVHNRPASRAISLAVGVFAVVWILPVLWVLILSFKPNEVLMLSGDPVWVPPFTFKNYINIMETSSVFRWLLNSAIVSVSATVGVLFVSSLAGYGFARLNFPFRRTLFVIVLIGLAIPEQAVIIARHQLFTDWNLHNTYTGLVLPHLSLPFGVFLMTQFFRGIPREQDEAAILDNASRFKVFWSVLLPQSMPVQATLGIFTFLLVWNDYFWPLISATRPEMYTLTVGIASVQGNFAQSEGLGYLMAQAVFAGLPALIVYLIFQKQIIGAAAGTAGR